MSPQEPSPFPPLLGQTREELEAFAEALGEPSYRGRQLAHWLYGKGARSYAVMTDLPQTLRARLEAEVPLGRSALLHLQRSRDGTVKFLLEEADGERVEAVLMPYERRLTVCLSSQVGCPMGCLFCATGLSGFTRNLTAGEMVDQVLTAQEFARRRISNVVFMGMGEPLLNYEQVLKAVRLLHREMGIGMRHITLSTVGHVPGIRRLAEEGLQLTLAISLHAPNDELRRWLIPHLARFSLEEILAAAREYGEKTRRRVSFEYVLLSQVNDSPGHAKELASRLRNLPCHVNLIPFNPVAETDFRPPEPQRVRAFREVLERAGIAVTQRLQRGADIDAACGQLRRRWRSSQTTTIWWQEERKGSS